MFKQSQRGFTLIEMAIVMVIVMALMGGMIATLSGQMDTRAQAETEQTLADIREALLGFAAAQGRLPCPAAPNANGNESFDAGHVGSATNGWCSNFNDGYVPGTALGITPTNAQGYVVDGWNQPIRYAVTIRNNHAYTTSDGVRNATMSALLTNNTDYLTVCSKLNGGNCDTNATLSNYGVAVVLSTGKEWARRAQLPSTEEAENNGDDTIFVSHDPTVATGTSVVFNDITIWLSPYTLYSRMIVAGKLP
jgi:prepilin-type N-terminal cleavage/methylation domain-containing protein